jgi:hypothetical protein
LEEVQLGVADVAFFEGFASFLEVPMQSRFQFLVTLGLAVGLGAALSQVFVARTADAYPAGVTVSTGTNPIVSVGGSQEFEPSEPASLEVMTAPADQDLVITDVRFDLSSGHLQCGEVARVTLTTPSLGTVGEYSVMSPIVRFYGSETAFLAPTNSQQSMASGLRVPAGEALTLTVTHDDWGGSYCTTSYIQELRFTLAGYLAQR